MKFNIRKFITDIHLWLGIGSGIIIFLICLSGTLLTFRAEIENYFDEKWTVFPESESISLESLIAILSEKGSVSSVKISGDVEKPYEFRVKTSNEDKRGTIFLVNPYTAEVLQPKKTGLHTFFINTFKMHRWMLVDSSIGRPIVGVATIIFIFLTISGLIIWFPKKLKWKNMKKGLKIKFSANWKRINHDLHNTLGFYSAIFLLIMALTGLNWSFEWYRDGAGTIIGTKIFDRKKDTYNSLAAAENWKSIEEIYALSNAEAGYTGETTLSIPSAPGDVFRVYKQNPDRFVNAAADQFVIDRDGVILERNLFSDLAFNQQIAALIKPIHTGEVLGGLSKIIYFIVCLFATSLPVTGTIIWINKLRKKKRKSKNRHKNKFSFR